MTIGARRRRTCTGRKSWRGASRGAGNLGNGLASGTARAADGGSTVGFSAGSCGCAAASRKAATISRSCGACCSAATCSCRRRSANSAASRCRSASRSRRLASSRCLAASASNLRARCPARRWRKSLHGRRKPVNIAVSAFPEPAGLGLLLFSGSANSTGWPVMSYAIGIFSTCARDSGTGTAGFSAFAGEVVADSTIAKARSTPSAAPQCCRFSSSSAGVMRNSSGETVSTV